MLGYLEQSVASAVIDCLSTIGIFKPKFPSFSSTKSALYYVGLYLKGEHMSVITEPNYPLVNMVMYIIIPTIYIVQ